MHARREVVETGWIPHAPMLRAAPPEPPGRATPRPERTGSRPACCSVTVPALSTTSTAPLEVEADVLVLGVAKTEEGPRLLDADDLGTAAIAAGSRVDRGHRRPRMSCAGCRAMSPRPRASPWSALGTGAGDPGPPPVRRGFGDPRSCAASSRSPLALPVEDAGRGARGARGRGARRLRLHRIPGGVLCEATKLPADAA